MRSPLFKLAPTLLLVWLTGLAHGQATGAKLFGLSGLAKQKGVQAELKMTKQQADMVLTIITAINAKYGKDLTQIEKDLAQLSELKGQEYAKKRAEVYRKQAETYKAAGEDTNKSLAASLSPAQMKRLQQIHIQQRGPYAFGEPEVSGPLKLTKEQQKKMRSFEMEYQKALLEVAKIADLDERNKKVGAAARDALGKQLALLSDDQMKVWKDLTGEPYKGK
jgi:hypothetical protein